MGTWPTIQACALTGNGTGHPLVHRLALNPLKHTSQGWIISLNFFCLFSNWIYSWWFLDINFSFLIVYTKISVKNYLYSLNLVYVCMETIFWVILSGAIIFIKIYYPPRTNQLTYCSNCQIKKTHCGYRGTKKNPQVFYVTIRFHQETTRTDKWTQLSSRIQN